MLDTRDLLEELEQLNSQEELSEEEVERRSDLLVLQKEIGLEFRHGVTLFTEQEAEDYFREMAEDCGMIDKSNNLGDYIDWERWADDCLSDYTSVDFNGETYYYRS